MLNQSKLNLPGENHNTHIPEPDLVMAANGELSSQRAAEVRCHLDSCWNCRTRMKQLEDAITGFVRAHQESMENALPPADCPRALLKAQLAQLAAAPAATRMDRFADYLQGGNRLGWVGGAMAAIALVLFFTGVKQVTDQTYRLTPDPQLTPGATLNVSTAEVCAAAETPHMIPASVGRQVFDHYGIDRPKPKAYEMDYLIAPELGGADDPRNFWPQPTGTSEWNAHVKDALEDQLHKLVCEDKITLATAQHDISTNWIQAYKKYFQTQRPIASHMGYAKDRAWEY